mgnify:CR=1 FL=1
MARKTFQEYFAVMDSETLGSVDDSVILSAGFTVSKYTDGHLSFDDLVKNGLYRKFNIKEQLSKGRKTQKRVIGWWYDQDAKARSVLVPQPDDTSLYDFPAELEAYFKTLGLNMKDVDFYDRKSFDLSKLQYLYEEDLGRDIPWSPTNDFEVGTAFRFMGYDRYAGIQVKDIPGATYHHALHDAAVDHIRLLKVFNAKD